jgi:large subunit ribosomal protein L21
MYAVIKTGGKQYRVATGEKIKVEKLAAEVGHQITLDKVLAIGSGAEVSIGSPFIAGATVLAKVLGHGRHDKVRIFKMQRRKHYQKRQGHRQGLPKSRSAPSTSDWRLSGERNGTEEGRRLYAKRARFSAEDAGCEGVWRTDRHGRIHHRPPAWDSFSRRPECRNGS